MRQIVVNLETEQKTRLHRVSVYVPWEILETTDSTIVEAQDSMTIGLHTLLTANQERFEAGRQVEPGSAQHLLGQLYTMLDMVRTAITGRDREQVEDVVLLVALLLCPLRRQQVVLQLLGSPSLPSTHRASPAL